MKRLSPRLALALAAVWAAAGAVVAQAANEKKGEPLSETHRKMARMAGDYTTANKLTLPGGKVMESKGTARLKSVLGGRFLQEENSGTMAGKAFTGLRVFGYNDDAKRFEAIWTYTGSTAMMTLVGKLTEDGGVKFKASYADGPEKKTTFTIIYRPIDDDTFTVDLISGEKGPHLTTTYTRKR